MARPLKTGLDYFPLDVDFFEDDKIMLVSAAFGIRADGIILRLMCRLYRNGYFLRYDDDLVLLLARSAGDTSLTPLVRDVVQELVKRGFFDERIFNSCSVLTSRGIQKRYYKICVDSKRKGVEILPEYDLIDISSGKALKETGITTEITTESTGNTPEFNTQSKVKESKEKKSSSSADADERASSATRNDDDSLQKSSNNDFSGNDDFFEKMTDNDLNDAETLRDRIRMLFGYYTRKEPHPREVADVFALFGNPVYKKRTTLTIVLQAFREQPARSAERQNTRYLMKVIEGRLAEMRERTLAKRKQERQLMEYRASPGGGVASLDAMVNELKEVFDEEPRTVN